MTPGGALRATRAARSGPAFTARELLPRRIPAATAARLEADECLAALLDALGDAPHLTAQGAVLMRREVSRALRVNASLDQADAPARGDGAVDDPIIVTGLPRTGTTLLHHLLASVGSLRTLRYWEAFAGPERATRDPVGSQREAARYLDMLDRLSPKARRLHPMSAAGPEECILLQQATLASDRFAVMATLPRYQEWLDQSSLAGPHLAYRRLLGQLPSDPHRTWLLKCPTHARHLEDVLLAFPRARLVLTHRDPAKVMPSFANLICNVRAVVEEPDPTAVAREWLPIWVDAMSNVSSVRRRRPELDVVDVHYSALLADPVATAVSICSTLGVDVDDTDVARMDEWLAAHPQLDAEARAYDADDYGLVAGEVRERFAPYMEESGVATEPV